MLLNIFQSSDWHRPLLIVAGLVFFLRGAIGLFGPDYWGPHKPLDYAAVVGTSLGFAFLAAGLWNFYQQHPGSPGRAQTGWRIGMILSSVSAAAIAVSNFLEDVLGVPGLGMIWVTGILALFLGLLTAGGGALWVNGLPRWTGSLLLVTAVGLLFIETAGFFAIGVALLIHSGLYKGN